MNDFYQFVNIFLKRLFLPLKIILKKIYPYLPVSIKKQINTQSFIFIILIFLLLCLILNYFWPKNEIDKSRLNLSRFPWSPARHIDLALVYLNNGYLDKAFVEINKAEELYKYIKFFDFKNKVKNKIHFGKNLINKPSLIEKEINLWQTVLTEKPSYKDAYIHLSILYYQLYQNEEAKNSWQKAFYLDPNSKLINEVKKIIFEQNSVAQD